MRYFECNETACGNGGKQSRVLYLDKNLLQALINSNQTQTRCISHLERRRSNAFRIKIYRSSDGLLCQKTVYKSSFRLVEAEGEVVKVAGPLRESHSDQPVDAMLSLTTKLTCNILITEWAPISRY